MKKLLLLLSAPARQCSRILLLAGGFLILHSSFIIHHSFAQSPNWLWAKAMGGTSYEYCHSIATDASGNVYTTGRFNGTVDFDPGAGVFNLTSAGNDHAMFISKLDSSGNFVWAKAIGGSGAFGEGFSIANDRPGNGDVYTTGVFSGTVDFDPGTGVFNLTSAGFGDIFVSKLDSAGNFVWAKAMGGPTFDGGRSIAIDPAGNGDLYTTGFFSDTVDFDPGPGTFNLTSASAAYSDIFISKLDSSGNFVWAKAMGGTDEEAGNSISIDSAGSGDVYTFGDFGGTADFDPGVGVFNLTSAGSSDVFISKLDSSGNFVWAKAMGGPSAQWCASIAIDPAGSGDVYTAGSFWGTADFDPDTSVGNVFNLTSPSVYSDIFISKLDSSGNFVWAKRIGGTDEDKAFSIVVDPAGSGDVYTTGHFYATTDFDPGAGVFNLTAAGHQDIFISKLDGSGNFVWAKAVGGNNSDLGISITLDASNNVLVTGFFHSSSFSIGSTTLTNVGNSDLYIAKLDNGIMTGNNEIANFVKGVLLFPNPLTNITTISFSLEQPQKVSLKVTDISGRIVAAIANKIFEAGENEIIWNAADVDAGVYFLQIQTEENLLTEKLIVTK